jgi:hypothetical protein
LIFSGVSKLIRPRWSSGPKSPQVEPSGRFTHLVELLMLISPFVLLIGRLSLAAQVQHAD